MTASALKQKLSKAFSKLLGVSQQNALGLLPAKVTSGKAYEAHVLAVVCEALVRNEGCRLVLKNGSKIVLKTGGGPINRAYPLIEVWRDDQLLGEMFTDIYFTSMSYSILGSAQPTLGEYHELDIVLTKPGAVGMPAHDQLLMVVECKNTEYHKGLLKEVLGVRREMGLLSQPTPTIFRSWPASKVPSDPASCLLVYCSSRKVNDYSRPGSVFGIQFVHEVM